MLQQAFRQLEELRDHPDPDEQVFRNAASILNAACDHARKLGIDGTVKHTRCITPVDAMEIVGKLIRWTIDHATVPDMMTVPQVASALNVSEKTVYAICDDGSLPHCRIGKGRGALRISKADLEEFKRQNRTQPARQKDYLSD